MGLLPGYRLAGRRGTASRTEQRAGQGARGLRPVVPSRMCAGHHQEQKHTCTVFRVQIWGSLRVQVRAKDAVLRKFFQNVDVALRGARGSTGGIMLARPSPDFASPWAGDASGGPCCSLCSGKGCPTVLRAWLMRKLRCKYASRPLRGIQRSGTELLNVHAVKPLSLPTADLELCPSPQLDVMKCNTADLQPQASAASKLQPDRRPCACQEADTALEADAAAALGAVDARLRDNMDTRGALDVLQDLILRTNKYMEQRSESGAAGAACSQFISVCGAVEVPAYDSVRLSHDSRT